MASTNLADLDKVASAMLTPGKGLLAATATRTKRFRTTGLALTVGATMATP